MAEQQWTVAAMQQAADAIYSELAAQCQTEMQRWCVREIADLRVSQLQLQQALRISHQTGQEAARLAQEAAAQHRVQIEALSRRLEALERKA